MSFHELIDSYLKKYPDVNPNIAKAALRYYNDIDFTVSVTMIKEELKWKDIERSIKKSISVYEKEGLFKPGDLVN